MSNNYVKIKYKILTQFEDNLEAYFLNKINIYNMLN